MRLRLVIGSVLILVITMLLSLNVSASEKVEIVWTGRLDDVKRAEMWQRWADEYNAINPGVTVKLVPGGVGNAYYETLQTWMLGDTSADIMWFGVDIWRFADVLLPLDDLYAKDPVIREIVPNMINTLRWKGRLIGIPYGVNSHVMYYNKDIFEKHGVAMPSKWNWDQALAIAKKMTVDSDGDGKMNQWGMHIYTPMWSLTYGGDVYTTDLRRTAVNNDATIAGVQTIVDIYTARNPVGFGKSFGAKNGLNGTIAMGNMGVWEVPLLRDNAPFDWDVTLMPAIEMNGKDYNTTYYSAENWGIYGGTKHPEEAKAFLSYIMSREKMSEFATLGAVVPTQPSVATQAFLSAEVPANMRAFSDALQYWKQSPSDHPGYSTLGWSGSTWAAVVNGEIPAAIGIPEIARQVDVALDEWFAKN